MIKEKQVKRWAESYTPSTIDISYIPIQRPYPIMWSMATILAKNEHKQEQVGIESNYKILLQSMDYPQIWGYLARNIQKLRSWQ